MAKKFLFTVLAFICSTLFLTGCATTTQKDHAERNKNISLSSLLGEKPLTEAQKIVLVDKYNEAAMVALEEKKFNQARRNAAQILKLQPDNYNAEFILAEVELGNGNPDSARKMFETLNEKMPSAKNLQGIGLALINSGQIKSGRDNLKKAVEMDPNMWRSLNGLGVSYALEKKWNDAEQAYQKALSVNAASPQIYNNLGLSYLHRGQYSAALKTLSQALAQPNGVKVADENYRWAQALNGQMDLAMKGLDDANRAILLNNLGQSALDKQEYRKAISYFKSAVKTHPNYFLEADQNLQIAIQQFN